MARPDFLRYKVSGKIVKLLGRQSVSTDTAALFELVKNAYDADATKISIRFENIDLHQAGLRALRERYKKIFTELKSKHPDLSISQLDNMTKKDDYYIRQLDYTKKLEEKTRIIIEDNGTGMTLDRLENKWMVVGVDKNAEELITLKGRRVVGEKGVGRFAAEKLSKKLILTSNPIDVSTGISAEFEWETFTADKSINEIKIPLNYFRKDSSHRGLKLELIHLREEWPKWKIQKFIRDISILIPPKFFNEKQNFSITVKVDGQKQPIEIESTFLDLAPYHFVAELTEDSKIVFTEAYYKRKKIIPTEEKLDLYGLEPVSQFKKAHEYISYATCGPLRFTCYGFPFDPSDKDLGWTEYYKRANIDEFQDKITLSSGIKIYRDGFRIRPYGDLGNDWLEMDDIARKHAGRLPSRNVIGWVEISSEKNPNIVDTTTREKIIENEAFDDIKDFLNQTMTFYAKYAESRRQDILKKQSLAEIPKLIKKLGEKISDNPEIPTDAKRELTMALNNIQSELTNSDARALIEKESLMDKTNAYRNLASLGIATGVVSHEMNIYLRDLLSHSDLLQRKITNEQFDKEKLLLHLNYINPSAQNLDNYMQLVRGFTSAMGSRLKDFRKKQNLNLEQEITKMYDFLKSLFEEWDIHYKLDIPSDFPKLRMFSADLQSIVLNLTSNSIKSLKHFSTERKTVPISQKNTILVYAREHKDDITIRFSDNGLGIPFEDRKHVFELFWTRTASREPIKSGSGLGLPITRELISNYGGTINIEDKSDLKSGVTFKIVFPKKEVVKND